MKTKNNISIITVLALAPLTAHADLTFTAPGMTTPYVATQLNKSWVNNLGHYWRYSITGYSYQFHGAAPNGGRVAGDALLYKTGNSAFPGLTQTSASITGLSILSDSLSTSFLYGTTGLVSHTFSSPIVIKDKTISASFDYNTNMVGGADFITIYGTTLKAPPIPVGTLTAPSYVRNGGQPTLQWFISKSLGDEGVTSLSTTEAPSTDSPNSGHGGTNNGHGNNEDGIDSSNPGKSAAVWAKKGFYDTDYDGDSMADDDEGHGGGSAISRTPVE
jgi:hypothetical protein